MNTVIPPGEDYSYCVEITEKHSLLLWGFASEYYDVSFKIERIDSPELIFSDTKVKCDQKPKTGFLLIKSQGLYKVSWINSYSWFNTKHIRYRVAVLRPIVPQKLMKNSLNIIETINEKQTNNLIPIGIWYKAISIVYHQGIENELSSLSKIPDFIQRFSDDSAKYSVGIVTSFTAEVPKLDLPNLYTCIDSDALALYGLDNFHVFVIAVVCEAGVRVSVAGDGRILVPAQEKAGLETELGKILALFEPAVVLVAGSEAPSLENLENCLKSFVPAEVLQRTYFKNANHILLFAASMLFSYKNILEPSTE